jgi:hypothetical protein
MKVLIGFPLFQAGAAELCTGFGEWIAINEYIDERRTSRVVQASKGRIKRQDYTSLEAN